MVPEENSLHAAEELQQSVSVAVAYFEDTLNRHRGSCYPAGWAARKSLSGCWAMRASRCVTWCLRPTQQGDAWRHPCRGGGSAGQLMRIQLNLASRKFVELGPLYFRLRILIILLAVMAVPLWLLLATEKRKAAEAQARWMR
jgi:hypothetical protein